MPTAQVALDTTQYVRVNVGLNRLMLQSMRDAVRIAVSDAKPAVSNTSFHILTGADSPLQFDTLDANVWALATSADNCTLIVTESMTHVPVSSQDPFTSAGQFGKAFARSVPINITPNDSYSISIQRNSEIAVRFVRAKGLQIDAVYGNVTGNILALPELFSTNARIDTGFFGSLELYDDVAIGDNVLTALDELNDSFYLDGNFSIQITNTSGETVDTFISIGVEQLTSAGSYTILQPDTQLEFDTEMGQFNGSN